MVSSFHRAGLEGIHCLSIIQLHFITFEMRLTHMTLYFRAINILLHPLLYNYFLFPSHNVQPITIPLT